jgi:hypothetical protein
MNAKRFLIFRRNIYRLIIIAIGITGLGIFSRCTQKQVADRIAATPDGKCPDREALIAEEAKPDFTETKTQKKKDTVKTVNVPVKYVPPDYPMVDYGAPFNEYRVTIPEE